MANHTKIIKQINELTMRIQREHPELYARLDEAPITLSPTAGGEAEKELENYLQTLKDMLEGKEAAQKV